MPDNFSPSSFIKHGTTYYDAEIKRLITYHTRRVFLSDGENKMKVGIKAASVSSVLGKIARKGRKGKRGKQAYDNDI